MAGACYPLAVLPGLSRLFAEFVEGRAGAFYPASPVGRGWMHQDAPVSVPRPELAALLSAQNDACHAGSPAMANIEKLRHGARAVVTGQQVALFGGPLYTLHKAATAVRLAQDATAATGIPHVPVFWLATEDHDFAEIDHVVLPAQDGTLHTVRLTEHPDRASGAPVGALRLGASIDAALNEAAALLGHGAEIELLRRCYRPEATFAGAFAQWLAATFREQGLVVMDAAGRAAHALGAPVLRRAITEAAELETLLLERGQLLEQQGYHQQVLVKPGASLLFLLAGGAENAPHTRLPLKRTGNGSWTAGSTSYSTEELLEILGTEPERLSPNALLRPVFQDAILPTAAYIGGPAEIAYFAQNGVLHERLLGRSTVVLPRLSATLISARQAEVLEHDGIDLPELFRMPKDELTQRVGARAMPLEAKQRLHAVGSSMSVELDALTAWMTGLDEALGRSAAVAASKMRYQLNRLRRLAAQRELERDGSIRRRVSALYAAVYPGGHLQERAVGASAELARHGSALVSLLVDSAGGDCPGHKLLTI
ncbi:bacillithiol biosynthesis cysteine-adding enzyme BshC [Acidipila sp. EB88]|uniref:bacillithiol biosynthesis cysteine-adding enzyme BshC n=1 Tax=Acidipila sp. EB88 TaxID=2305226 RepID=UPI000F5DBDA2|nr:bacillithiol biosynthesis cysteine-adding enzyme BshC [Acidipila sp. EB88]RRA47401.1 bacillithiol biosynthesis cysteine-adding enzyme BshC [Acidipila sp. EB88]